MGFDEFILDRGERLLRAAWLLTGDRQHAEDLLQTALVKCWSKYDGDDDRFEGYVRTTLHRTYISWWRRRSWHEQPVEHMPERSDADARVEVRLDLARALRTLSRPQRAAITLRYFDDLTVPQVARTLGMPEGTVKAHLHRGIQVLRNSGLVEQEELA